MKRFLVPPKASHCLIADPSPNVVGSCFSLINLWILLRFQEKMSLFKKSTFTKAKIIM